MYFYEANFCFRIFILLFLLSFLSVTSIDNTKLQSIVSCVNEPIRRFLAVRGKFWVFYNYVTASRTFKCYESVTYTTHADYSFLDNLEALVERWDGPISLAIYAPGTDFDIALKSIAYLRNCKSSKIKQLVTFHVFFDISHNPNKKSLGKSYKDVYNCKVVPPYKLDNVFSFRHKHNLTYPINVARNIARISASSYFVFPSDIELYPVYNFSRRFMKMIFDNPQYLSQNRRDVYVVPVFEVNEHSGVPTSKTELKRMFYSGEAHEFHIKLCSICHKVPQIKEWMKLRESEDFNVFITTKRKTKYAHWEPFYVGTHREPLFDERLTWEGQYNKMSQAYAMCLLDYNFNVLDNAFLVHKPGIKKAKDQLIKYFQLVVETNTLIRYTIKPELLKKYGKQPGCQL